MSQSAAGPLEVHLRPLESFTARKVRVYKRAVFNLAVYADVNKGFLLNIKSRIPISQSLRFFENQDKSNQMSFPLFVRTLNFYRQCFELTSFSLEVQRTWGDTLKITS